MGVAPQFLTFASGFAPALALLSAPALADEMPPGQQAAAQVGEIIVTAQRRVEPIVDTPLSISAFSGDLITHAQLRDVKDLVMFSPGLSGGSSGNSIDTIAIRGIVSNDYGVGGDPAIGIFKDGVYQGRTGSAVTALYDIERAEVLRGPQSFLFGRNAISGAISIVTAKPKLDRTGGYLYLGYGETDRKQAEGAINLPLSDRVALRVSGYHLDSDGWVENVFAPGSKRLPSEQVNAARVSLLYDDKDALRIVLTGEYEKRRQTGRLYRATNADREVIDYLDSLTGGNLVIGGSDRTVDSDLANPDDHSRVYGLTLQIDRELGFATFSAITGYRRHRYDYVEDYDGTPLLLGNFTEAAHGTYASQELRLVSPNGGALSWSAGLSGYRDTVQARFTNQADEGIVCAAFGYASCEDLTQDFYGISYVPQPGGVLTDINSARGRSIGFSAYGEADYHVAPRIEIGAGARYTWDRKKFALDVPQNASTLGNIYSFTFYTDGYIDKTRTWRGVTPRAFIRFEANDDLNLYASVTRGYKAGGFGSFTVSAPGPVDTFGLVPAGTTPDAFEPETSWSKEIGAKGYLFGRKLQFDVAGFHYVYRNLQTTFFDTVTRTQRVINVGRVRGYGAEAMLTYRPSRYFDLMGNATYARTVKTGDRDCTLSDCGGLPNPTWMSSGVATVHYPIGADEIYLSGEWRYQSHSREAFDWRGLTRRDAYTLVNLRAGYRIGKSWELSVSVQNLLDKLYYAGAENGGDLLPANKWDPSQPRNVGADLRFTF